MNDIILAQYINLSIYTHLAYSFPTPMIQNADLISSFNNNKFNPPLWIILGTVFRLVRSVPNPAYLTSWKRNGLHSRGACGRAYTYNRMLA